jgi:cytochrome oxidase Cu insertion factor (SCO1/SenC/PrrC family)
MRMESPGSPIVSLFMVGLIAAFAGGCGGNAGEDSSASNAADTDAAAQEVGPATLGPRDGLDLPPTELERVAVGTMAPDFSLLSLDGETFTLSDFLGKKNVVLVFYRGHW